MCWDKRLKPHVFQVCDGVGEICVCFYTNYNLQASSSACTSKSSVCISCLDMRPYTDHQVKAVSLATAEICVESRGGVGVDRKGGREQSIVIVKRVHRQTWLPRENRLCTHCSNRVVEDEFLFLTECNKYNNIRETY